MEEEVAEGRGAGGSGQMGGGHGKRRRRRRGGEGGEGERKEEEEAATDREAQADLGQADLGRGRAGERMRRRGRGGERRRRRRRTGKAQARGEEATDENGGRIWGEGSERWRRRRGRGGGRGGGGGGGAELLGFDKYIAPFASSTNQDILRGVNYGSGGSGILDETGHLFGDVINFNEQLSNHEVVISKLLGSESVARKHLSRCIYTVGMGNNDYLANYLPQYYAVTTPYTPHQFASLLIAHYSKQLRRLYDDGARKVAVFALGKLGCIPQQLATYGTSDASSCVETSNDVVQSFNENLKILIHDLNRNLPDAKFVYTRDTSDSESHGNISNLSEPCCGVSAEDGQCVAGSVPCSNRDAYLFWDSFHPTEAATLLSAKIAYGYMSPLFAESDAVAIY
ncbi:GDSL esterase/lipase [Sesamum angolense]|uniref:GDSL esterase/lipase n=1 Tax=Sesamum angolense TaxID=2727404 RepID=A0AAE1WTE8_9LAMI|nr:GDSL esterase/lipase [Sesamum angolense]